MIMAVIGAPTRPAALNSLAGFHCVVGVTFQYWPHQELLQPGPWYHAGGSPDGENIDMWCIVLALSLTLVRKAR